MSERLGTGGLLAAAAGGFRLGALHPLMHPPRMSPSPELYLEAHADLQPLDFSTKKGKMSPASDAGENSDSDRCSLPEEGPGGGALNLAPERPVWSRSSESGVSVTSASPDRPASPPGLHGPPSPMATSPPRGLQPHLGSLQQQLHAHLAHAPTSAPAAALNSTLLSQLHSNPLLFSTLQSALSKSKMGGHPFKAHLPARSASPPPMDYPAASSSPTPLHPALARAPAGLGGLPGGAGLGGGGFGGGGLGGSGLGGSGLGGGGLGGPGLGPGGLAGSGLAGGGGLLGPGALGMSSGSPNPAGGLGALDGLVGGLGGGLGGGGGPGSLGGVMGGRGAMAGGMGGAQGEAALNAESNEAYSRFRDQMLAQVTSAKARRSQASRTSSQGSGDARGADAALDSNMDSSQDFAGDAPEAKAREDGLDAGDTQSCTSSSGSGGGTKRRGRASGDGVKDEAYWERRRKNNEAAKRSRDARRAKEDEIAIRAAFLEQENLKLRVEVASLKSETAKLRCMLYNS
ncbi:translation initiation factor IF-2-like [Penaeus monodon]|uniref:translation initiation factor IF-2-like n=1 Tax=Penaeus monodon TaxID=6687 RepID=UPI0018A76FC2|nr:translation initiation factor IF-2-like [Penaeus monodon]